MGVNSRKVVGHVDHGRTTLTAAIARVREDRLPSWGVIASPKTWMESDAIQQLQAVAALAGMVRAVGMPDLHPGKGAPIGAVFACAGWVYPYLIGNDIGCGMGLWRTEDSAITSPRCSRSRRLSTPVLPPR